MKKKLLLGLLAAAAVSFTACQKNEVISEMPQDNAISFNTYLGRGAQTKGSIVEIDQLKAQGFGVFAYYTGTTAVDAYSPFPATPNFMNNVQVTYQTDAWKYTGTKYWPKNETEKLSFYAYGPYDNSDVNAISIDATSKKPELTYIVDNAISNHMDVLFTPAQEDKTVTNKNGVMAFVHALSRVEFEVKTANTYSDYTMNLKSVTLSGNIHPSGTLALGGNTANWDKAPAETKSFSIEDDRLITPAGRRVEATQGTPDYIMILPQDFTGTGNELDLNVQYSVKYLSGTAVLNDVDKKVSINLEQGKAYKIIINISMDEVTFTASMTPWDEDHNGFTTGTPVEI